MASCPITLSQIDGRKREMVADFIFLVSKITVDCDCSHEIKRRFLLGRKAMTNLDSILKSRYITLLTKIRALIFPVFFLSSILSNGCESWTIKKAEWWRIDAFQLWCWRSLFIVPRTARRSNQSLLKKINLEYSLERLMVKLKLQYFGHLMQRADSLERPWCWKDWGQGEKGAKEHEMIGLHHWLSGHGFEQTLGGSEG